MIRATAHDDERIIECTFDATPYFEQADDEELADLAECGWGGDYPSDRVARHMEDLDDGLRTMFRVVDGRRGIGFECYVREDDALAWIQDNRTELYARIEG